MKNNTREVVIKQTANVDEMQIIKEREVTFKNLPKQDYARCKAIVGNLLVGEYTIVSINDYNQFMYFLQLLTERNMYFSVNMMQYNSGMYKIRRTM